MLLADLQIDDGDLTGAARQPGGARAATSGFVPGATGALPRCPADPCSESLGAPRRMFDSLADAAIPTTRRRCPRATGRRARSSAPDDATRRRPAGARSRRGHRSRTTGSRAPAGSAARSGRQPRGAETPPRIASVDSAAERIRVLRLLGMDVEASFEVEALFDRRRSERGGRRDDRADADRRRLSGARAPARRARARPRRPAVARAAARGVPGVARRGIGGELRARLELDPALVAGLIRQESTWNPDAVSPVGARGLMQLMPSVGASIASGRGYPVWDQVLLFDPDVSMQLGTRHLASSLRGNEDPTRALAAYNAGASRVTALARVGQARAIRSSSRSGSRSSRRGTTCARW